MSLFPYPPERNNQTPDTLVLNLCFTNIYFLISSYLIQAWDNSKLISFTLNHYSLTRHRAVINVTLDHCGLLPSTQLHLDVFVTPSVFWAIYCQSFIARFKGSNAIGK